MELHMVFFKEEYGSATDAVKHSDGLTVLAFFYEVRCIYDTSLFYFWLDQETG